MVLATSMLEKREEAGNLPPSALEVLNVLRREGRLTPKELFERTDLAPRTVRYALRVLLDYKLVKKVPNLQDLRQNFYVVSE